MKRHNKILVISLSIVAITIILSAVIYRYQPISSDPKEVCLQNSLTWLEEFNECEFISQETCESLNGEFVECGSACRHDPEAEYCIQMCVPYCDFD
jgi:hypothetical protein